MQENYLGNWGRGIAVFSAKVNTQVHDLGDKVSGDDVVQHVIMEQVAQLM